MNNKLHPTQRCTTHNQKIISIAFKQICSQPLQCSTHLHLLAATIDLGIRDGDFKIWKCKYASNGCYKSLENWTRENIRTHPKLRIRDKVIVYWVES